jgi:hypothetical protein
MQSPVLLIEVDHQGSGSIGQGTGQGQRPPKLHAFPQSVTMWRSWAGSLFEIGFAHKG